MEVVCGERDFCFLFFLQQEWPTSERVVDWVVPSDACAAPQQWRQPHSHEACRSSGDADESCSAGTRRDQTSVGVLHLAALETWSSPRESGLSA